MDYGAIQQTTEASPNWICLSRKEIDRTMLEALDQVIKRREVQRMEEADQVSGTMTQLLNKKSLHTVARHSG